MVVRALRDDVAVEHRVALRDVLALHEALAAVFARDRIVHAGFVAVDVDARMTKHAIACE